MPDAMNRAGVIPKCGRLPDAGRSVDSLDLPESLAAGNVEDCILFPDVVLVAIRVNLCYRLRGNCTYRDLAFIPALA